MYLPNWMYGLLPESWWPDPPREMLEYTQNVISLPAGQSTLDLTFSKRFNMLVWGGCCLLTNVPVPAAASIVIRGPTLANPIDWGQVLVALSQPSSGQTYTQQFEKATPQAGNFVPLDNLFATGAKPGQRWAIWPCPIKVARGGALNLTFNNLGSAKQLRITYKTSIIFPKEDRLPRSA